MLKHLAHLCIERIVLEAKVTWYVTYCHMIYIAWRTYYPVLTGSLVFFFFNSMVTKEEGEYEDIFVRIISRCQLSYKALGYIIHMH